jgi:hypothetical protein
VTAPCRRLLRAAKAHAGGEGTAERTRRPGGWGGARALAASLAGIDGAAPNAACYRGGVPERAAGSLSPVAPAYSGLGPRGVPGGNIHSGSAAARRQTAGWPPTAHLPCISARARQSRPRLRHRWLCLLLGHAWRLSAYPGYSARCGRCRSLTTEHRRNPLPGTQRAGALNFLRFTRSGRRGYG